MFRRTAIAGGAGCSCPSRHALSPAVLVAVLAGISPARAQPHEGAPPQGAQARPDALPSHTVVTQATELTNVELGDRRERGGTAWRSIAWGELAQTQLTPGAYAVRFQVAGGDRIALEIPVCAGRGRIAVDGVTIASAPGPVVTPLPPRPEKAHEVEIEIAVGGYERRIACSAPPRFGATSDGKDGLGVIAFRSPAAAAGGGHAVVFLPPGHDARKPTPLLVGLHPWNGSIWTYAAYAELLREAAARDVVLLFPSGLGNSLYTAPAEDEVFRAIDALGQSVAIDPQRVSIWGASMGGAGATTIGLHRPDRFATITSFFGDSRYDLGTYVKAILPTEAAAHQVNALDVIENARHVPIWLIHGEDDKVSPVAQSTMLAQALAQRGFKVRFDRVPNAGHSGALVARFAAEVVARASDARAPASPSRVSFRSVRPTPSAEAYGVHVHRTGTFDAVVDIERRSDAVHLLEASGVRAIELDRGALGAPMDAEPSVVIDDPRAPKVDVRWLAPVAASTRAPSAPPGPASAR